MTNQKKRSDASRVAYFFLDFLRIVLILLAMLLRPFSAVAQDSAPSESTRLALAGPTNADLLLFWEEKELFVETATRTDKPLTQVAENMTVISAKDIHDMNARSVSEVLNRVPGVFIDFNGMDFSSNALPHIQGSESRHVTILLDGIYWNSITSGEVDPFNIPVQIIDRIEIIKGPASSAWGSALGGVINIITKGTGNAAIPNGIVTASYGEANSQDHRAELYGKAGTAGYYLYAGRQSSDGLRKARDYRQNNLYGKISLAPTKELDLVLSLGYSDPRINIGDTPEVNIKGKDIFSSFFASGAFDYRISQEFSLKGSGQFLRQMSDHPILFLSTSELYKDTIFDEKTVGGNLKLVYSGRMHTAVAGAEYSHGILDQATFAGPALQSSGAPASVMVSPNIDKWALFTNDCVDFGKLAVTPGIRLDHDTISGYFFSPSIGATYELGERSVARATVARGFTSPGIGLTSAGGSFLLPNRSLKEEQGWSYQLGMESGIVDLVQLKVSLFRHDIANELYVDATQRTAKIYRNGGDVTRQGYELEAETVPWYNISLKLGHAYVHKSADSQAAGTDLYSHQIGIKYDDRRSLVAQLMGSYVWWNLPADQGARYDNFIWDLALNKRIFLNDRTSVEGFLTVHNLFSGAYYTLDLQPNPLRWVEGGVRFRF
ncbi:MAG TPA: TonB-dependent receptor [Desulfuromonadaceae bacterium]